MLESHYRSIAKAVSYRVLGTVVTFLVALLITRQLETAIGIGFADTLMKTGLFYVHERLWNRTHFGKTKAPDYQI